MAIRVVVMSDIHGNGPALHAVHDSLPEHDAVFVAGDLCLEGPCPAAVVDLIATQGWIAVMGNTDRDILDPPPDAGSRKGELVAWTREQLGTERLAWLSALPFSRRFRSDGDELLVVHANPLNMNEQLYPDMTASQLQPYIDAADATIMAFGHLHIPYVRPVENLLLIDVSSVGHPKDHDLRAAYTVITWDGATRSVQQVRVPYDVEETVRLMRESGMPHPRKEIDSLLKASY
jgi:predicted phosphodiesterase